MLHNCSFLFNLLLTYHLLKKNLEKQVDVYKDANNTNKAIKVILYFTDEEYEKTINILNELELLDKPGIVLIDARTNKVQASKA